MGYTYALLLVIVPILFAHRLYVTGNLYVTLCMYFIRQTTINR